MQTPHRDVQIKYLLVDLDGTLLGNKILPLSFDFVGRAIGSLKMYGGWRLAIRTLLSIYKEFRIPSTELTNDKRVVELFSKRMKLDPAEGRRVLREAVQAVFPPLKKHFYPIEGAREFLDWAKTRYPLTLATNPVWPSEVVKMRVQWAGIDPEIFSFITDVRNMRACKPSPAYYEEILRIRDYKPEECLLVGNDLRNDLGATRVGIRVFIVGNFEHCEPIKKSEGTVPAWRGSYAHLRTFLETPAGSD